MKIFEIGDVVVVKEPSLRYLYVSSMESTILRCNRGTITYYHTSADGEDCYEVEFNVNGASRWLILPHEDLMKYEEI